MAKTSKKIMSEIDTPAPILSPTSPAFAKRIAKGKTQDESDDAFTIRRSYKRPFPKRISLAQEMHKKEEALATLASFGNGFFRFDPITSREKAPEHDKTEQVIDGGEGSSKRRIVTPPWTLEQEEWFASNMHIESGFRRIKWKPHIEQFYERFGVLRPEQSLRTKWWLMQRRIPTSPRSKITPSLKSQRENRLLGPTPPLPSNPSPS